MIVIPIEVKSRELFSRLLVALHCLDKGYNVVIGRDEIVHNCLEFERSIVFLKSIASFESKLLKQYSENNNYIYTLDEEGILPPIKDPSVNSRYSNSNMQYISKYFLNGNLERDVINAEGEVFIKTGNPRIDLCKKEFSFLYSKQMELIKKQYGNKKIILIASRFGDVNCHEEIELFSLLRDAGYIFDRKSEEYFKEHYRHTTKIFNEFLKLPHVLNDLDDTQIVIRPHPSESINKWNKAIEGTNAIVSSEYDITAWLHAGVTLIHNGCTTAVEAAVNGSKVISFKPFSDANYDNNDADAVGEIVSSFSELRDEIKKINVPNTKTLDYIVYNREKMAWKTIGDYLTRDCNNNYSMKRVYNKGSLKIRMAIYLDKLKVYFSKQQPYRIRKFVSLNEQELKLIINEVSEELGIDINVRIKKIAEDSFLLQKIKKNNA